MKEFFVAVDQTETAKKETWTLVLAENAEKAVFDFAKDCAFEVGYVIKVLVREAGTGSVFLVKTNRVHTVHKDREPF